MILSSKTYLDSRFTTPGTVLVSNDLHDALKALNEAAHKAMRQARGTGLHSELMALRLMTDALVDRAHVSPVVPNFEPLIVLEE